MEDFLQQWIWEDSIALVIFEGSAPWEEISGFGLRCNYLRRGCDASWEYGV